MQLFRQLEINVQTLNNIQTVKREEESEDNGIALNEIEIDGSDEAQL